MITHPISYQGGDNGQFKGPPRPVFEMEKPNNIIDLNPILNAARAKEVTDRYLAKLKAQGTPDKIQKAIDETRNTHMDGAKD